MSGPRGGFFEVLTPEYRGLHSLAIGLSFMHKLFYFGHLAFGFWLLAICVLASTFLNLLRMSVSPYIGVMCKLFCFDHLAFGFWPFVFWPQRSLMNLHGILSKSAVLNLMNTLNKLLYIS